MKHPIKAIVFDFGGVLLDWDPRNLYQRYFSNQQAMENFLAEIQFHEWNAQQDKGRTFAEGIAELSSQFPHYAHLIQAYYDDWEESITGSIGGTVDILRALKKKGYPLYGLSNWSAETFPRARQYHSFFDLFDDILLSGDVKLNKPDPDIFKLLLSKIGYPASECLLIDDSQANVETATKLGFAAIRFESPEQLQSELKNLGLL